MALKKRILRIRFDNNQEPIDLDASLNIRVRISKQALTMQQKAQIEVTGLTTQVRESLLSQFTAWNRRDVDSGNLPSEYTNVTIDAGYLVDGKEQVSQLFVGQVVQTSLTSSPPDIGVLIECYTRQFDKSKLPANAIPPVTCTFLEYVKWCAQIMGFGENYDCETSYNDKIIENPARSIPTFESLIWDIQNYFKPDVAAFIDNGRLIVRDRNKIIDKSKIPVVRDFIGIPMWQQWGVQGTVLLDPTIKLAGGVTMFSEMNPSLNGTYVIHSLEYDLASRRPPFYVRFTGAPPG